MLLLNVTWDVCATCTVTAGAPLPAAAVVPRILKFSNTTDLTPVTLEAGQPIIMVLRPPVFD